MPRIRTIKPEFWSSPGIEKISPWARLVYIAMWNWADDFGRGTFEARELMGFIFPRDEDMTVKEFRGHVGEVHRQFGVVFYNVGERPYFEIPSWKTHQKSDPRLKQSKYPGPDEGIEFDPANPQVIGSSTGNVVNSNDMSGKHTDMSEGFGAGTGEQGNRGTVVKDLAETGVSGESETAEQSERPTPKPKRKPYPDAFEEWWKVWPKRTSNKKRAHGQWVKAVKRIEPDVLMDRTQKLREFVEAGHQEPKFIVDAERWLRDDRWEDELIPPRTPRQQSPRTDLDDFLEGHFRQQSAIEGEVVGQDPLKNEREGGASAPKPLGWNMSPVRNAQGFKAPGNAPNDEPPF